MSACIAARDRRGYGMVNVFVWRDLAERYRPALMQSKLLHVKGKLEDQAGVKHLIAGHLKTAVIRLMGYMLEVETSIRCQTNYLTHLVA